ncbi:DDE-type integrase/transposase/recombinase [Candidatus Woesearchaeota archaeon]|nr:DDE-type integrase/transposase/recombinase [Candidatus Woesearchaeota archaeon]
MDKELIRKEFFKLKNKGFSYSKARTILRTRFDYSVSTRTLKRWIKRLEGDWNLKDLSRKPKKIHKKISPEIEQKVIELREQTGWGQDKLYPSLQQLGISSTSIKRIIKKNKLCRETKPRGKRIKWIRWQRKHPNSLWQIDHSDQKIAGKWCLSVIDDCSRYSLALIPLNKVTTQIVTHILDKLIKIHGKPREILTDNGSAYGLKSKHSKFDRWCRRKRINHIRTAVHSPTTSGKVERLFQTIKQELQFCNNDIEQFRMRYNHFRPHSSLKGNTPADIYHKLSKPF